MAKTQAQIEKRKRETDKRKKIEKAILKLAAAMPDHGEEHGKSPPTEPGVARAQRREMALLATFAGHIRIVNSNCRSIGIRSGS